MDCSRHASFEALAIRHTAAAQIQDPDLAHRVKRPSRTPHKSPWPWSPMVPDNENGRAGDARECGTDGDAIRAARGRHRRVDVASRPLPALHNLGVASKQFGHDPRAAGLHAVISWHDSRKAELAGILFEELKLGRQKLCVAAGEPQDRHRAVHGQKLQSIPPGKERCWHRQKESVHHGIASGARPSTAGVADDSQRRVEEGRAEQVLHKLVA